MWGDESEGVAPIIWLYQTVDAQKEEILFPDLLITLRWHVICLKQNIDMCLLYKSHQIAPLVSHLINHFSEWMFTM